MAILINSENLDIIPDDGRRIIENYIDFNTSLKIVEEISLDTKNDSKIYVTTIDTVNNKIIQISERSNYIDYGQKIEYHDCFKTIEQRDLNEESGYESITGEIFKDDKLIFSSTRDGFFKEKILTIYEFYTNLKNEEKREIEKSSKEYNLLSKEEQVKYWAGGLFRSMRMQEESRQNPYAIYSENWLKETLKLEPNFIEMLPEIYNVWGGMFDVNKVDNIIQRLFKNIKNTI
ncbi:hypothetical protein [Flavobacterium sp. LC2016-01]|uniref:hypothetical protein n=1 Tax=Flavobacterium sp. LC2016-01 TaxID=2675876 RepID=UPI0012BABD68|nr:hypothetical protein [Flavobacterium sp. LC2016-01]MTH15803.1 hypothetical protein [Flavobacterium sp. LC2016-01]